MIEKLESAYLSLPHLDPNLADPGEEGMAQLFERWWAANKTAVATEVKAWRQEKVKALNAYVSLLLYWRNRPAGGPKQASTKPKFGTDLIVALNLYNTDRDGYGSIKIYDRGPDQPPSLLASASVSAIYAAPNSMQSSRS